MTNGCLIEATPNTNKKKASHYQCIGSSETEENITLCTSFQSIDDGLANDSGETVSFSVAITVN